MGNKIYPSLMCADFSKLDQEVQALTAAGSDMFHMDIMDGQFVPNFALGFEDLEAVKKISKVPMDVHMMVKEPGRYVSTLAVLGAAEVDIHFEADAQPSKTLNQITHEKMLAGLAINPSTSIASFEALLPIVDRVLVMTVNPGFAGQPFLDFVVPKIKALADLKDKWHFKITVDGAISPERIKALSAIGVDNFVVGTSSLFGKEKSYGEILPGLKEL